MIMLKWMLEKKVGTVWIRFICFRIRTDFWGCWNCWGSDNALLKYFSFFCNWHLWIFFKAAAPRSRSSLLQKHVWRQH
jgi:hypothetical protein